eukprot:ANDGO_04613.mRNA.1 hypothetical protein
MASLTSYQPLSLRPPPKTSSLKDTAESRYWKSYAQSHFLKLSSAPTCLSLVPGRGPSTSGPGPSSSPSSSGSGLGSTAIGGSSTNEPSSTHGGTGHSHSHSHSNRHSGSANHVPFALDARVLIGAGTAVTAYSAPSFSESFRLSKFMEPVLSVAIRPDHRLIAASTFDAVVKVFDSQSRSSLRVLQGHSRPIHALSFLSQTSLVSGSDDAFLKIWDVSVGKETATLEGHSDYVRTLAVCPFDPALVLSGSYDHSVVLWDVRMKNKVRAFHVGRPVESVVWTSRGMAAVGGGPAVSILNILSSSSSSTAAAVTAAAAAAAGGVSGAADVGTGAGTGATNVTGIATGSSAGVGANVELQSDGGSLTHLIHHQKTVTCLAVNADGTRLLSGGLDQLVKVYDLTSPAYPVVHTMRYDAPILGLAFDDSVLVALHANSTAVIKARSSVSQTLGSVQKPRQPERTGRKGSYSYMTRRGTTTGLGEQERRKRLAPFDRHLKSFEYAQALDAALETRNIHIVCSLFEELTLRDGVEIALANRDESALEPVLAFFAKHIVDPFYAALLIPIAELFLDIYSSQLGVSATLDDGLFRLRERLQEEVALQNELGLLQGQLESILNQQLLGNTAPLSHDL